MNEYKYVDKMLKSKKTKKDKFKRRVISLCNQILLTTILFLGTLIAFKMDKNTKNIVYDNVYDKNFEFASFSTIYQKYLGNILPLPKKDAQETLVFQEKLTYKEANLYKDGVALTVDDNYMVPLLESGVVVFIGDKDEYGTTVIIQQVNGVDTWYGNVTADNIKMYDYVEKGDLLGETKNNQLYLVFQKEGKYLDYKEYIT